MFTWQQRAELLNGSMSRIICDNSDIREIPRDAFTFRKYPSGYIPCHRIPSINLAAWREERSPGVRKMENTQTVHAALCPMHLHENLLSAHCRLTSLWPSENDKERGFYFVLSIWQTGGSVLLLPWFQVKGGSCNSL